MSSDLIQRLRATAGDRSYAGPSLSVCDEAADALEAMDHRDAGEQPALADTPAEEAEQFAIALRQIKQALASFHARTGRPMLSSAVVLVDEAARIVELEGRTL